jgi:uncharacterized protein YdhG (YjbR/CyaY superfamily)
MKNSSAGPQAIDEYIADFPPLIRRRLKKVRQTIRKAAPKAQEKISYRIPTYLLNGILIYYAGFANHISVYPAPRGNPKFKTELAKYKGGKGTVQFPHNKPIPFGLITRIVKFRATKNLNEKG